MSKVIAAVILGLAIALVAPLWLHQSGSWGYAAAAAVIVLMVFGVVGLLADNLQNPPRRNAP